MIKKAVLIYFLFFSVWTIEFVFSNLSPEIRIPLFFTCILLTILLFFQNSKQLILPKTFSFLFVLLMLSCLYSGYYSQTKFLAVCEIMQLLSIFLLVTVVVNLSRIDKSAFSGFFLPLWLLSSFLALVGILEFTARNQAEKSLALLFPLYWPSLSGSFYLLLIPSVLVTFLITKDNTFKKPLLFCILALLSLAFTLTNSHQIAFIALTGFILGYFFYHNRTKKGGQGSGNNLRSIILLFLLSIILLPNLFSSFGDNPIPKDFALNLDKFYFMEKSDLARFSWETAKKNIISGVGPGNFGNIYKQNLSKSWVWSDYAGNILVQNLVETGIPGLLVHIFIYTYLLIIALKKIYRSILKKNDLNLSISLSVIFFLLINLTDFSLSLFPIKGIFFLLVAFLLNEEKMVKIGYKTAYFLIVPTLFVSFFLLTDGFLLNLGQRMLLRKKTDACAKILNYLAIRPLYFLNPKVPVWQSALEIEKDNIEAALVSLEQAKKTNPYNQEIDYQIALIYQQNGDIKRAQEILLGQISNSPYSSPVYYLQLAKIASQEENIGKYLFWLNRATLRFPIERNQSPEQIKIVVLRYNNYLLPLQEIYFTLASVTHQKQYLDIYAKLIY